MNIPAVRAILNTHNEDASAKYAALVIACLMDSRQDELILSIGDLATLMEVSFDTANRAVDRAAILGLVVVDKPPGKSARYRPQIPRGQPDLPQIPRALLKENNQPHPPKGVGVGWENSGNAAGPGEPFVHPGAVDNDLDEEMLPDVKPGDFENLRDQLRNAKKGNDHVS